MCNLCGFYKKGVILAIFFIPPRESLKNYIFQHIVVNFKETDKNFFKLPPVNFSYLHFSMGDCIIQKNSKELKSKKISLFGNSSRASHFNVLKRSIDKFIIVTCFKPYAIKHFFNTNSNELENNFVELSEIESDALILEDKLLNLNGNTLKSINEIENYLEKKFIDKKINPNIVTAIEQIHNSNGNIQVEQIVKKLNISERTFYRNFNSAIGTSPKKFSQITRLGFFLTLTSESNKTPINSLEAGYFDQSHFIKEFKSFFGESPSSFLDYFESDLELKAIYKSNFFK